MNRLLHPPTEMQTPSMHEHRTVLENCRFCPMCKPKGEVSLVTREEIHTTRGRAMVLWRVAAGHEAMSERAAALAYEASLDSSSRQWCFSHIDVPMYIRAARIEAVRLGLQPARVESVAAQLSAATRVGATERSSTVFYGDVDVPRSSLPRATGQPDVWIGPHEVAHAFDLGYVELARELAAQLRTAVDESSASTVIADGPGAQYVLAILLPLLGHAMQPETKIVLSTIAIAANQKLPVLSRREVGWHDSSYLRFTSISPQQVRESLKRLGLEVREFRENGLLADDVGIEGALYRTHPELARLVAERRMSFRPSGAQIVTDCPTSASWMNATLGTNTVTLLDEFVVHNAS